MAIIAAGNCALVKPNEMSPNVSAITAEIIRETFDPGEIAVFEGNVQLANNLLDLPVDHIFFTGSPAVGKIVMAAAAKHLASVTLGLSGKNPVIVDRNADIADARILSEEVLGPILSIFTYRDIGEVYYALHRQAKPLALYIFTRDDNFAEDVLANTTSGGVMVNNCIMHVAEYNPPFGGVNNSGMGRYHGVHGFRELSHERAVLHTT